MSKRPFVTTRNWVTKEPKRNDIIVTPPQKEIPILPLPKPLTKKVGARLKKFAPVWERMGAHPSIVHILKHGYKLPFLTRPQLAKRPTVVSGYRMVSKDEVLHQQVLQLLQKGAIVPVHKTKTRGFYSRLFLVPKKSGGWRPVIDLSSLNRHLKTKKFKMETPESIRLALQPGDWVTSIDLSDAYLHIPIHPRHYHFLRFHHRKRSYCFVATPFGLSTAPNLFTEVARQEQKILADQGIKIHQYLDDWLIPEKSKTLSQSKTPRVMEVTEQLGFIPNLEKSELAPTQQFNFVGYHYDLRRALVFPQQDRLLALEEVIRPLLTQKIVTARRFMGVLGLLAATERQVPNGRLHMRHLQYHLRSHWKTPQSLETHVPLFPTTHEQLRWWLNENNTMVGSPLHKPPHTRELFTDASTVGWGGHCDHLSAQGTWPTDQTKRHINWLEMKAVLLCLQQMSSYLSHQVVLVSTDNSTVLAHINKQGGTRSWDLCALLWQLQTWCSKHSIVLHAKHIAGQKNVIADLLSRTHQDISTEWTLHPEAFKIITNQWGNPHVDLFATKWNHQLPIYVSPLPDPTAWEVDALSISWTGMIGYAYPPTHLIPQCLNKIRHDRATIILVAPWWPRQTWLQDIKNLAIHPPIQLPWWNTLLRQPHRISYHPHPEVLNLHVWMLSYPNRPSLSPRR